MHLVRLGTSEETLRAADEFYSDLRKRSIEVLYDDRPSVRPGEKFADADLIGIPLRVVISDKTIAAGKLEVKSRTAAESELVSMEEFLKKLLV